MSSRDEVRVCQIRELGVWEAVDAYQGAFAVASAEELTGRGGGAYYLRQAALETVIARRMRIGAVISIHRAVLAGVPVAEIAHVLGCGRAEVAEDWRGWARGQRHLDARCPGLGMGQREYDRAAALIGAGSSGQGGEGGFAGCACERMGTQIGSPRP